jgi:hypothetical protein
VIHVLNHGRELCVQRFGLPDSKNTGIQNNKGKNVLSPGQTQRTGTMVDLNGDVILPGSCTVDLNGDVTLPRSRKGELNGDVILPGLSCRGPVLHGRPTKLIACPWEPRPRS